MLWKRRWVKPGIELVPGCLMKQNVQERECCAFFSFPAQLISSVGAGLGKKPFKQCKAVRLWRPIRGGEKNAVHMSCLPCSVLKTDSSFTLCLYMWMERYVSQEKLGQSPHHVWLGPKTQWREMLCAFGDVTRFAGRGGGLVLVDLEVWKTVNRTVSMTKGEMLCTGYCPICTLPVAPPTPERDPDPPEKLVGEALGLQ